MKKWTKHIVLLLLIVQCVVIFGFSAHDNKQSSVGSVRITEKLIKRSQDKEMSMREQLDLKYGTEKVVRKTAHLLLFFVLGVLATMSARQYLKKYPYCAAMAFCLLYAISDEIHQELVPGRAGLVSDVLIDFAGSILGIGLLFIIIRLKRRKKV